MGEPPPNKPMKLTVAFGARSLSARRSTATDTRKALDVVSHAQKRYPVTQAIARRELEFRSGTGTTRIVVRIGRPRRDAEPGDTWVCPYDITGFSKPCRRWAFGIDGVQALTLAYHIIPSELDRLARIEGGGQFYFLASPGIAFGDGCGMLVNHALDAAAGGMPSHASDIITGQKWSQRASDAVEQSVEADEGS